MSDIAMMLAGGLWTLVSVLIGYAIAAVSSGQLEE